MMTRSDIANDVLRECARHIRNPSRRHWKVLLQVATYMNAAKEIGLEFVRGPRMKLFVHVDADYAAASNDGRFLSDAVVMLRDTVIG